MYRDIVLSTHPDKTGFIAVESVKKKFSDYYQIAVDSYNSKEYENLLFVANDIGIEIEDDKVKKIVSPKLNHLESEIARMKKTVAYEWSQIVDDRKVQVLSNYLRSFEKVKRIKRKRGTRPVNYIKKRIK